MARKNKSNQVSREYILKAFVSLLQTEPYDSITVTDITKAAGVSRMAYYRNFTAKDQILTTYLEEIGVAIAHPRNDFLPKPKNLSEYIVLLFKRLVADTQLYEYNLGKALRHAGLSNLFLDCVIKGMSEFFPPQNEEEELFIAMMAGAFFGIFMRWSETCDAEKFSYYADQLYLFLPKRLSEYEAKL
jgi:AcrR family transcriptional regulator